MAALLAFLAMGKFVSLIGTDQALLEDFPFSPLPLPQAVGRNSPKEGNEEENRPLFL